MALLVCMPSCNQQIAALAAGRAVSSVQAYRTSLMVIKVQISTSGLVFTSVIHSSLPVKSSRILGLSGLTPI